MAGERRLNSLAHNLLRNDPVANSFFVHRPDRQVLFELAKDQRQLEPGILEAIIAAQDSLPADSSRKLAIEKLRAGSRVIVAGQQPGVCGGPLLTDFKIATAIALRDKLDSAGISAVVLFWNASEDHDLDEANRIFLRDPDRTVTHRHRLPIDERRSSLHRYVLDDQHIESLRTLFHASGETDLAEESPAASWRITCDLDESNTQSAFCGSGSFDHRTSPPRSKHSSVLATICRSQITSPEQVPRTNLSDGSRRVSGSVD